MSEQQGANITFLRAVVVNQVGPFRDEIERACDDIEQYRELLGLFFTRKEPNRLRSLLKEMTWGNGFTGNGFTEADYDRAIYGGAPHE